jgi:cellulose synthase/poly-beta-1,6-N-acetylglucosamine synthase-like glycosyltransferase
MRSVAKRNWGLMLDDSYEPKVSLIIPTYNEASIIAKKLENVQQLDYPSEKLQVILVDSASTDGTLAACRAFQDSHSVRFPMRLLLEKERMGKSHALNNALEYAVGEIIALSDADSFWNSDVLRRTCRFFSDPSIGAVTGREKLVNLDQSVHTQSEGVYRDFYYCLRLGESKIHSTYIFQGELSLYRKSALGKFEDRPGYSDDTGTVIRLISEGFRCVFVPDAVFRDTAAYSLQGRLMLKSRRSEHLIAAIAESVRLKISKRFPVPSVIVFFNFYVHVISPLLLLSTGLLVLLNIQASWFLLFPLIAALLFKRSRLLIISYTTSNLALVDGLIRHIFGRKQTTWQKVDEMRP